MQIGLCDCSMDQTGASCKHQLACAREFMMHLPQAFKSTAANRRWLAVVAVGEENAPPIEFFSDLEVKPPVEYEGCPEHSQDECFNEASGSQVEALPPTIHAVLPTTSEAVDSLATTEVKDSPTTIEYLLVTLKEVYKKFGDGESPKALDIWVKRLKSVKSSSQFNSYFSSFGSSMIRIGGAGRGKIPCQLSSIAKREAALPRGAAPIGKGRKRKNAHVP